MTDKPHQMGRREFLVVSSTAVAASATVGPSLLSADRSRTPDRMAVGFAPFDENAVAVSAASIRSGDEAFIARGARVSVFGARSLSSNPRARRAVDFLAHYPVFDGASDEKNGKYVPFRAWASSRQTAGCVSNVVSFTMPVDETQKVLFTFETERGLPAGAVATRRDALSGPTESSVLPVTLAVNGERDSLKLVRGFYVMVPMFPGDSEPRWSSYAVRQHDERWALVDRDGNRAGFESFVLRIDYATQS